MKNKYVLRWQYGVFAGDTRTHYTYGSLDMLKYKAKYLVENEDICYITIDKVEEVIKDTRLEVVEKSVKSKI